MCLLCNKGMIKSSNLLRSCILISPIFDDPGKVEGNVVFTYLSIFDPNQNEVNELKKAYQKGGLGDVEIKKRLIGILNTLLDPIREKREYLAKKPEYILEVLKEGEKVAAARVNETAREVREAIGIQYY